ncbi:bifunctional DNA primase/polymerase [Luedemannella helvata]|uniref:Bifunctional DNA primase/polymerase n=1 Tax=Luedemannella helvata TaxID=349315 RepID=A0ABP4X1Y8_9ACTN
MSRATVAAPPTRRLWPAPQAVRRSLLRRAALRYADHEWPVLPGAFLDRGRYSCGPMCPTVACHPAVNGTPGEVSYERDELEQWWSAAAFSVLFATGTAFDVIEVPAALGAAARDAAPPGPVAVNPNGHWMFFVAPGDALRPELAKRLDMVLHGSGSWVPAPPTYTPLGRVHWEVSPESVGWRLPWTYAVQHAIVGALPAARPAPATTAPAWALRPAA